MHSSLTRCRIITGERDEGKTTLLLRIASSTENPKGFVSLKTGSGYNLRNLENGEERLLMTSSPLFPDRIGRWYYDASVFSWAEKVLLSLDNGMIFLDEIGKLELQGLGFAKALSSLLEKNTEVTITVRREYLQAVIEAFRIDNPEIISVGASL